MKKETDMREKDLDGLFAQARAQIPLESGQLMARILADAVQLQPPPIGLGHPIPAAPKPGLWAKFAATLGGHGVIAGLGTAAVAGVILGFSQPASLTALTDSIFAQTPVGEMDLLPGIDAILTEG